MKNAKMNIKIPTDSRPMNVCKLVAKFYGGPLDGGNHTITPAPPVRPDNRSVLAITDSEGDGRTYNYRLRSSTLFRKKCVTEWDYVGVQP